MHCSLPPRLVALAAGQDGLVTAGQALGAGLSRVDVATRCRRGEWGRLARGVYLVDADLYADGLASRVWWRAAVLSHGPSACLVGTTAARAFGLHGLPLAEPAVEVGLIGGIPRHHRRVVASGQRCAEGPGIVLRQLPVRLDEVVSVDGIPVRCIAATVVDAGLEVDRPTALALLDSAVHQRLIALDDLQATIAQVMHRRGVVALRDVARLVDGRAESQVESRVRLACVDGGVPPDDLQYPVYTSDGHLIAIGDLAWLRRRRRPLLGEADGVSVHSLPDAVFRDRRRGNALVGEACDTVRFTFADSLRPAYIVSVVRAAIAA